MSPLELLSLVYRCGQSGRKLNGRDGGFQSEGRPKEEERTKMVVFLWRAEHDWMRKEERGQGGWGKGEGRKEGGVGKKINESHVHYARIGEKLETGDEGNEGNDG